MSQVADASKTTAAAAEKETSASAPEEPSTPIFALFDGGDQFYVTIPPALHGKWVSQYRGSYNQGKRAYTFLMKYLSEVERSLGLKTGESGLKDPKYYVKIIFQGELYAPSGAEKLKEKVEGLGATWKRQNKAFVASIAHYDELKPFFERPKE